MKKCFAIFLAVLMCLLTLSLSSHERITENLRTPLGPAPPEDMMLIPSGEFQMGSDDEGTTDEEQPRHTRPRNFAHERCCLNKDHGFDERPRHTVYVDAFYMDMHEVTNAQYKTFVEANPQWQKDRISAKYHDSDYLMDWHGNNYPDGEDNHPVAYVSWYAAMAYSGVGRQAFANGGRMGEGSPGRVGR